VVLNSFDVLLMSYSECNFNTNACPAKLWDYLGTLLPIVANTADSGEGNRSFRSDVDQD
jgi:hypothetical protein